jgi:hypothetical protein
VHIGEKREYKGVSKMRTELTIPHSRNESKAQTNNPDNPDKNTANEAEKDLKDLKDLKDVESESFDIQTGLTPKTEPTPWYSAYLPKIFYGFSPCCDNTAQKPNQGQTVCDKMSHDDTHEMPVFNGHIQSFGMLSEDTVQSPFHPVSVRAEPPSKN